jgi:hypothetical protein
MSAVQADQDQGVFPPNSCSRGTDASGNRYPHDRTTASEMLTLGVAEDRRRTISWSRHLLGVRPRDRRTGRFERTPARGDRPGH